MNFEDALKVLQVRQPCGVGSTSSDHHHGVTRSSDDNKGGTHCCSNNNGAAGNRNRCAGQLIDLASGVNVTAATSGIASSLLDDVTQGEARQGDEPAAIIPAQEPTSASVHSTITPDMASADICTEAGLSPREAPATDDASAAASSSSLSNDDRMTQIKEALQEMTSCEVITAVTIAQQERVMTYRHFDDGLKSMLQGESGESGGAGRNRNTINISDSDNIGQGVGSGAGGGGGGMNSSTKLAGYVALCQETTAAFALLSATVNAARDVLKGRHESVAAVITRLQKEEENKLLLTTAYHLDTIRQHHQQQQGEDDPVIAQIYKDGLLQLKGKMDDVVVRINDLLEELRYEAADMEDEEDD